MKLEQNFYNSTSLKHHSSFFSIYHDIFYERADPRIRDFPLMGDPLPMVLIYGSYAIFFKFFMPRIMQDRKPVDVRKYVFMLHIVLFITSAIQLLNSLRVVPFMSWRCEPLGTNDYGTDLDVSLILKKIEFLLRNLSITGCLWCLHFYAFKIYLHDRKCSRWFKEKHGIN